MLPDGMQKTHHEDVLGEDPNEGGQCGQHYGDGGQQDGEPARPERVIDRRVLDLDMIHDCGQRGVFLPRREGFGS